MELRFPVARTTRDLDFTVRAIGAAVLENSVLEAFSEVALYFGGLEIPE
jgi:hypothetical protein